MIYCARLTILESPKDTGTRKSSCMGGWIGVVVRSWSTALAKGDCMVEVGADLETFIISLESVREFWRISYMKAWSCWRAPGAAIGATRCEFLCDKYSSFPFSASAFNQTRTCSSISSSWSPIKRCQRLKAARELGDLLAWGMQVEAFSIEN